jgi:hypothetical protein
VAVDFPSLPSLDTTFHPVTSYVCFSLLKVRKVMHADPNSFPRRALVIPENMHADVSCFSLYV